MTDQPTPPTPASCLGARGARGSLTANVGERDRAASDGDQSASHEPVAHGVTARRHGTGVACSTIEGQGDHLTAAETSAFLADALVGRIGAPPKPPGVWRQDDLLDLDQVKRRLHDAGTDVVPHAA